MLNWKKKMNSWFSDGCEMDDWTHSAELLKSAATKKVSEITPDESESFHKWARDSHKRGAEEGSLRYPATKEGIAEFERIHGFKPPRMDWTAPFNVVNPGKVRAFWRRAGDMLKESGSAGGLTMDQRRKILDYTPKEIEEEKSTIKDMGKWSKKSKKDMGKWGKKSKEDVKKFFSDLFSGTKDNEKVSQQKKEPTSNLGRLQKRQLERLPYEWNVDAANIIESVHNKMKSGADSVEDVLASDVLDKLGGKGSGKRFKERLENLREKGKYTEQELAKMKLEGQQSDAKTLASDIKDIYGKDWKESGTTKKTPKKKDSSRVDIGLGISYDPDQPRKIWDKVQSRRSALDQKHREKLSKEGGGTFRTHDGKVVTVPAATKKRLEGKGVSSIADKLLPSVDKKLEEVSGKTSGEKFAKEQGWVAPPKKSDHMDFPVFGRFNIPAKTKKSITIWGDSKSILKGIEGSIHSHSLR